MLIGGQDITLSIIYAKLLLQNGLQEIGVTPLFSNHTGHMNNGKGNCVMFLPKPCVSPAEMLCTTRQHFERSHDSESRVKRPYITAVPGT